MKKTDPKPTPDCHSQTLKPAIGKIPADRVIPKLTDNRQA